MANKHLGHFSYAMSEAKARLLLISLFFLVFSKTNANELCESSEDSAHQGSGIADVADQQGSTLNTVDTARSLESVTDDK